MTELNLLMNLQFEQDLVGIAYFRFAWFQMGWLKEE